MGGNTSVMDHKYNSWPGAGKLGAGENGTPAAYSQPQPPRDLNFRKRTASVFPGPWPLAPGPYFVWPISYT